MAATKNQNSGDPRAQRDRHWDVSLGDSSKLGTRGNGRPDWRESTELICSVSLGGGSNVALFRRLKSCPVRAGGEKAGDKVPRWRHIFLPLGLGGKVDAVRAAGQGGRPSSRQRQMGRRDGDGDCVRIKANSPAVQACRNSNRGRAVREGYAGKGQRGDVSPTEVAHAVAAS